MKKIVSIFFFMTWFVLSVNAQNPEYSYLVKTVIMRTTTANFAHLLIETDKGGGGRVEHNFVAPNDVFFDFVSLPNDFNTVTLTIFNSEGSFASPTYCEFRDTAEFTKVNFHGSFNTFSACTYQQTVFPLNIQGPENPDGSNMNLCYSSNIRLNCGYDWDYQINTSGWKPLGSGKISIVVNVQDLYETEGISMSGQSILRFRTGYRSLNKFVAIENYTVTTCSPDFIEYYDQSNTTCSYLNDGKISVKVSRGIDSNEQFVATLFKQDGSNVVLINQLGTKQVNPSDPLIILEDLGSDQFGFQWSEDIAANLNNNDKYFFRYQTLNIGENPSMPAANDSFWDALVKTPDFRIEKPLNVRFDAEKLNDISCFNVGDGKIKVKNVSGGSGTKYEYSLNGNNYWTRFNGTNELANETTINSLSKGNIVIRVRDGNKCVAKKE
ncbi:SprB repeat-containing protein [Tenacibaculum sp. MAR_2009_124]|uniref:SprB repeat-containing protein n=1 Tax=Tenacibaculum sp. MAR_2009_124 TaxID=1250059 RepID=UPI00089B0834|nr:SprB repeat-containing protein [Tenacibaculum sp. MAR_2009_124]SEB52430.1 SprB repeat-containing protein [Tenacibaculum sp. MAR_2009_124]